MALFLMILAAIGIILLLIKPLIYFIAFIIFIFKTFGKAILFYIACIASFYFTRKLGLADKMPPVTTFQMVWCVIFVIFTPVYFAVKKFNKIKK